MRGSPEDGESPVDVLRKRMRAIAEAKGLPYEDPPRDNLQILAADH